MSWNSVSEMVHSLGETVQRQDGRIVGVHKEGLSAELLTRLAHSATLAASPEVRGAAQWLAAAAGRAEGAYPASLHSLYLTRGADPHLGFTAPVFGFPALTYDLAQVALRLTRNLDAAAVLFSSGPAASRETSSSPAEVAAAVLAAAARERHHGPLFLRYGGVRVPPGMDAQQRGSIEQEIVRALDAGFYNIDLDTSAQVDTQATTVLDQQRPAADLAAELTAFLRRKSPYAITVAVGVTVVGPHGRNTTVEELRAFMDQYLDALSRHGPDLAGPAKVNVRVNAPARAAHLPSGRVVQSHVDFNALEELTATARQVYGLAGAATDRSVPLAWELFDEVHRVGAVELDLSVALRNVLWRTHALPGDLREKMVHYLEEHQKDRWEQGWSREQFLYEVRRAGFGPFRQEFWNLSPQVRGALADEVTLAFHGVLQELHIKGSADLVGRLTPPPPIGVRHLDVTG